MIKNVLHFLTARRQSLSGDRHDYTLILTISWLAQCYLVIALPEMADEAYYTRWGENLRLGYLDHPPGVALWSRIGGRWLNLFLLPFIWILFADAARRLGAQISSAELLSAVWLTPLGVASGVLVTPDAPLICCWGIAVWGYARGWIVISALGVALGAWSKAMIWPAALGLGWLWWHDDRRHDAKVRAMIWLALSLLLYSPHLLWSWKHQGYPWTFQGTRRWGQFSTAEWLIGQILVGGGLWAILLGRCYLSRLYLLMGRVYDWTDKESPVITPERERVWWWLSAPSMLIWMFCSLGTRVEANWSALAWPVGMVWVLDKSSSQLKKRALRWGMLMTIPCLALPLLHGFIPLGWGPPRDGLSLRACLADIKLSEHPDAYSSQWWVGRYQEAALLNLPISKPFEWKDDLGSISYRRAWKRRMSQYDLNVPLATTQSLCGGWYLGPPDWIGPRCSGTIRAIESQLHCQIQVSKCECPTE